jgi:hypothetical protein
VATLSERELTAEMMAAALAGQMRESASAVIVWSSSARGLVP